MVKRGVTVVWTVENAAEQTDVLVSLDEAAAVDFARSQNAFVGHFVVRRSHLVGGRVV